MALAAAAVEVARKWRRVRGMVVGEVEEVEQKSEAEGRCWFVNCYCALGLWGWWCKRVWDAVFFGFCFATFFGRECKLMRGREFCFARSEGSHINGAKPWRCARCCERRARETQSLATRGAVQYSMGLCALIEEGVRGQRSGVRRLGAGDSTLFVLYWREHCAWCSYAEGECSTLAAD